MNDVKLDVGSDILAKLELQHIYKNYGNNLAVEDFSLRLNEKSFIVLAGPSGCGKTTLLQCIAGLLPIDQGHVLLNNNDITDLEPWKRNIAMVFQDAALFPHLTVKQNIVLGLKFQGFNDDLIDSSVKQITEMLSISELLDRKADTLSGGQQQRVAIARALVRYPDLFLMDEPLSSLDASLRSQLRIEIAQLYHKQEATFVYVTHDQTEAMTLASLLVIMKDGRIQQVGKPKELYENPKNVFVATFLGRYGMNIVPGCFNEKSLFFFGISKNFNVSYIKKDVYIGVRSQDVIEHEQGIQGRIILIEDIGDEIYYHVLVEDTKLIMKKQGCAEYQLNDFIYIDFNWDKVLFFDKKTEERVSIG